jgi:serine/threonine protein kinase
MELGENDLKFWMDRIAEDPQNTLEEEHVITIIYNILCGLNFIHSANLIHRDIKASNILMNDECRITFCDFGLARALPKKSQVESKLMEHKKGKSIHSSNITERH